jgi:hypothetical protein
MAPLLGAPKDLLQELQRDRRLPRCAPPNRCNPIFDLGRSDFVHSPPPQLRHSTQGLNAARIR